MRLFNKTAAAVGLGLALISTGALAQQQFINVLTGGQSGVYYPVGVAISQIYAKTFPTCEPRPRSPRPRWKTSTSCKPVAVNSP